MGGGFVHNFPWYAVRVSTMIQTGCCSSNMLFLMLVFGDDYFICDSEKKIEKQTCEDQNLPHVTSHSKR